MVNATKAAENEWLDIELVQKSPTKIAIILDEGRYEQTKFGERLKMKVSMDKKIKEWTVNQRSAQNLIDLWGPNTENWVNKQVMLDIEMSKTGKPMIVGHAYIENKPVGVPAEQYEPGMVPNAAK